MSSSATSAPTPRPKRPRDRRQRIEDAAAELFADRGFAATGVGEIAAAVGITGGAIYRHFTSKDALLEALVLDIVREFVAISQVEPGLPDARLHQLVAGAVDLTLTRPTRVATYLQERPRLPRELRSKVRRHERQLGAAWTAIVTDANPELSPGDVVVRQAAVNGVLTAQAERRHTVARPRLDELTASGLLAVLKAPPPSPVTDRRTPTQSWTSPRSRRLEIVDAAARLFRRHGYDGVGIDEIGEASGIAGPTVYGTFGSKAEILAEVYDRVLGRLDSGIDDAVAASSSASDALHGIVRAYADVAFAMTDHAVVASREGRELAHDDRRRVAARRAEVRHLWADVLRDVRPDLSEAEARTLVSATFALVQRVALAAREDTSSPAAAAELAIVFLLADPARTTAPRRRR